ncbi:MAG: glycosyl hydrolase [Acidobacteria bacterium]|nr:glycosyl hydrolase [Acidobacteriota bacterium]
MKPIFVAIVIFISAFGVSAQWIKQTVETKASFRGLSVVSERVVWASGTGGTVIKTTDGGKVWSVMTVPGAEKLDFRDIEAFDANTAYILSIGNGDASRIYKTTDSGKTWELQFTNKDEKAFYDAIACWDRDNCIAMSDPVDGKFRLIETKNGDSWSILDNSKMPPAKEGEAAFAASGTCLITARKNNLYLVSGGSAARFFSSWDRGKTWTVYETPMIKGTLGSGIFSIATRDGKFVAMVGGNYEKPTESISNLAVTDWYGQTWKLGTGLSGYRSGVAYIDRNTIIAVGTNGTDISRDRGATWKKIGDENLNAVAAKGRRAVWAVGPAGAVYRLSGR